MYHDMAIYRYIVASLAPIVHLRIQNPPTLLGINVAGDNVLHLSLFAKSDHYH